MTLAITGVSVFAAAGKSDEQNDSSKDLPKDVIPATANGCTKTVKINGNDHKVHSIIASEKAHR